MLIESELPKTLWTYTVQTAEVVRNRCSNNHTKQTPFYMLTGRQPNIARMQKFGKVCYAYKRPKGKLHSRCERGIFVGYDKNSSAYMVYYLSNRKIQKHRLVEFMSRMNKEMLDAEDDDLVVQSKRKSVKTQPFVSQMAESQEVDTEKDTAECDTNTVKMEEQREELIENRYPDRGESQIMVLW